MRVIVIVLIVMSHIFGYRFCAYAQKRYPKNITLQYVSCTDSNLMNHIYDVAFSDSVTQKVKELLGTTYGLKKEKTCVISIRKNHDGTFPYNMAEYNLENVSFDAINDTSLVQVCLDFVDDIECLSFHGTPYYTIFKDKIFIVYSLEKDYQRIDLFNSFFKKKKRYRKFNYLTYSTPKELITIENIDKIDIVLDIYWITYLFIYNGDKLYLDPRIDDWIFYNL